MTAPADKLIVVVYGEISSKRTLFLDKVHRSLKRFRRCGGVIGGKDIASTQTAIDIDTFFVEEIEIANFEDAKPWDRQRFAWNHSAPIVVISTPRNISLDTQTEKLKRQILTVNLDTENAEVALRRIRRRVDGLDAEPIGAFAGIAGLTEVGLGSFLHAFKVPLKGHFLEGLQNLMLVAFGKSLQGRGLVRISFITAMLKAFSPMGNALKPMLFIFMQGSMFAAPTRFLGWNILSVALGSVLMGWVTLSISLGMYYLTFGRNGFDAFEGAVDFAVHKIGIESPSLFQILFGVFLVKTVVSLSIGAAAFYGNVQPFIQKFASKTRRLFSVKSAGDSGLKTDSAGRSFSSAMLKAFVDLFRPRFFVMFILSVLLMRFFLELTTSALVSLIARGVCISYIGFLLMRRIEPAALGRRMDRWFGMDMERSLPIALKAVERLNRPSQSISPPERQSPKETAARANSGSETPQTAPNT